MEEHWGNGYTIAKTNKTTKGFTAYRAEKSTSYDWEAKGYIKD